MRQMNALEGRLEGNGKVSLHAKEGSWYRYAIVACRGIQWMVQRGGIRSLPRLGNMFGGGGGDSR
jgi:hypothetical protein